ncbi:MAG: stage II sporulation protein R [Oscillospiraceae bacterium]|nr:stage II sporulation protein R [Oscillospiraceae bacterium]
MPRILKAIIIAVALCFILSLCGFAQNCDDIRHSVLRLHILANSDSADDQALKLTVRDAILNAADGLFANAQDATQADAIAEANLPALQQLAQQTVYDNGYVYAVKAELVNMYFTTRTYDDEATLPAGMYYALRITIGSGAGHNWWCVAFPSLCLGASSKKLDDVLTPQQDTIVEQPQKYVVKLKIVEIFSKIFG